MPPACDGADHTNSTCPRSTSILIVHFPPGPRTEFEGRGVRIDEQPNPFTRGQATLAMLARDRFFATPKSHLLLGSKHLMGQFTQRKRLIGTHS